MYSKSCDRWLNNTEYVVKELISQVAIRKEAFDARRVKIADEKSMLRIITGLEEIVRAIPEIKHDSNERIIHITIVQKKIFPRL